MFAQRSRAHTTAPRFSSTFTSLLPRALSCPSQTYSKRAVRHLPYLSSNVFLAKSNVFHAKSNLLRCFGTFDTLKPSDDTERIPRKVIFMGTPQFAVPALQKLIDSQHQVVAVYTQPPRPAGRGRRGKGKELTKSPVHLLAEEHGIPVYTPVSLKPAEAKEQFASIDADIAAVAAYGLLLPTAILEAKQYGCLNIHPSLLPRWRGAAPLPRTLMAGDKQTGVCIMQLDEGMDTGPILAREIYPIAAGTTCDVLHDSLSELGGDMLLDVIDKRHALTPETQSEEGVTHAAKIQPEDGRLDFKRPAQELFDLVHGLSPVPGAFFEYQEKRYKVLKAEIAERDDVSEAKPGDVVDDDLAILCGDGKCIQPSLVLKPGKKPMARKDFLNGNKITKGTSLVSHAKEAA